MLSLRVMCATCLVAASLLAFHAPARAPARLHSLRAEFSPRASAEPRMAASDHDILLRVARGQQADRTPVWLMRQAGRYMADFRAYSDKYPFRMRSETPEIATELSLQPWRTFGVDGVIMFSDILTPLPALGIDFDVVKGSGPVIGTPLRSMDDVLRMTPLDDPDGDLPFIRTILGDLRAETEGKTTLLGFVGAPFTLVAYAVEGKANRHCIHSKQMMVQNPEVLHAALEKLAVAVGRHAVMVSIRRPAGVASSRRRQPRGSSSDSSAQIPLRPRSDPAQTPPHLAGTRATRSSAARSSSSSSSRGRTTSAPTNSPRTPNRTRTGRCSTCASATLTCPSSTTPTAAQVTSSYRRASAPPP